MKLSKIKSIKKEIKKTHDITVEDNHNFFCNGFLIHNCNYRGEICVILVNHSNHSVIIERGQRIAQFVFDLKPKIEIIEGTIDTSINNRNGGFGHTGK